MMYPLHGLYIGLFGGLILIITVLLSKYMSRGTILGTLAIWLLLVPLTIWFDFPKVYLIYALILVPSALWMPLTLRMLEQPSAGLWLGICLVLAAVALGSLGLLGALLSLRPRQPRWAYWLAVAGSVTFSIQTVLLDAVVWTAFFT